MMALKKNGTNKVAMHVAASMPPITAVPMAWRLLAPAPTDGQWHAAQNKGQRGHHDGPETQFGSMNSRRIKAAPGAPSLYGELNNKNGVFGRQTNQSNQRHLKVDVVGKPRPHVATKAPNTPKGTAVSTESGNDHDSYCAARIRKTITSASTKMIVVSELAIFS